MPELAASLHGCGTLGDVALSEQASALFVRSVALASLGGLTQIPVEQSSAPLVVPDVLVDRFMADLQPSLAS